MERIEIDIRKAVRRDGWVLRKNGGGRHVKPHCRLPLMLRRPPTTRMRRRRGRLGTPFSVPQEAVTHPHVKDEQRCAADAAVPLQRALTERRLADAFSPWLPHSIRN